MIPPLTTLKVALLVFAATMLSGCGRGQNASGPKVSLDESVGIETLGGAFTPLINSGVELPTSFADDFSTGDDNQTAVQLTFQAGKVTNKVRLLGMFTIDEIQPAPRGTPRIRVAVSVEKDGEVRVAARNGQTGITKSSSLGKVRTRQM